MSLAGVKSCVLSAVIGGKDSREGVMGECLCTGVPLVDLVLDLGVAGASRG